MKIIWKIISEFILCCAFILPIYKVFAGCQSVYTTKTT